MENILCVSPIDGRYNKKTSVLSPYFSEFALIKYRTQVEIKWLLFLLDKKIIDESITKAEKTQILKISDDFSVQDALKVKEIEKTTNHDVKSVEYFLREKFTEIGLSKLIPFIHIFLTSEDINNTSYNLMLKDCLENVYYKKINELLILLNSLSNKYFDQAMLGHTHGQTATPTTVGKEFKVFEYRLKSLLNYMQKIELTSKFSGAVGNYNVHIVAYPNCDWISLSKEFVESLGLKYNPVTTQIESHDMVCLLLNHLKSLNGIIKDLNSDMWLYISRGYFHEKLKQGEVGSSVMPHKVNPINHENSMANIEISNGLIDALTANLPISRMQRDLSDSSKMRNLGVIFAHSIISISETIKGLEKVEVNKQMIDEELEENYIVLSEAIQTILRKNKVPNAYEILKNLSRGKSLSKQELQNFIVTLSINDEDKKTLLELSPKSYIGLAKEIVKNN